ncbi:MAG: Por secretion system C-terminal sorting protein, partial [Bacteroidetes bacterium]|nr:Por secretion system C-terminal sorting protein [Bacteroidota bacterium]
RPLTNGSTAWLTFQGSNRRTGNQSDATVLAVENWKQVRPNAFRLEQNYPNPFNPSTTIQYALPGRSSVTLTLFNTLGQQVATLVQGEQEAGYHEVKFDASQLPSGVYLYRLQAGNHIEVRKALLMK